MKRGSEARLTLRAVIRIQTPCSKMKTSGRSAPRYIDLDTRTRIWNGPGSEREGPVERRDCAVPAMCTVPLSNVKALDNTEKSQPGIDQQASNAHMIVTLSRDTSINSARRWDCDETRCLEPLYMVRSFAAMERRYRQIPTDHGVISPRSSPDPAERIWHQEPGWPPATRRRVRASLPRRGSSIMVLDSIQ